MNEDQTIPGEQSENDNTNNKPAGNNDAGSDDYYAVDSPKKRAFTPPLATEKCTMKV